MEDIVFLPAASVSSEDRCKHFTQNIASALRAKGADNVTELHVMVDEGISQGAVWNMKCELNFKKQQQQYL